MNSLKTGSLGMVMVTPKGEGVWPRCYPWIDKIARYAMRTRMLRIHEHIGGLSVWVSLLQIQITAHSK